MDLWSVSAEVKGISKTHVAAVNTEGKLKSWQNGLDIIYPPILSLAYKNAVPDIPETPLQIGDFLKVV